MWGNIAAPIAVGHMVRPEYVPHCIPSGVGQVRVPLGRADVRVPQQRRGDESCPRLGDNDEIDHTRRGVAPSSRLCRPASVTSLDSVAATLGYGVRYTPTTTRLPRNGGTRR